jgi:hypothetical protein
MIHAKDSEQITFNGNGIKLLDLKREIVDKKKITGTLDFDLKIIDENKKGNPSFLFSLGKVPTVHIFDDAISICKLLL